MRLDLPLQAERSGRAAPAALPNKKQVRSLRPGGRTGPDHRPTSGRLACDFCGRARTRDERNRLVWDNTLAPGLVLAELCRRCATQADLLVELHGGCDRSATTLVQESRAALPPRTAPFRVLSFTARATLYVLIALTAFLVVTLVTSRGR